MYIQYPSLHLTLPESLTCSSCNLVLLLKRCVRFFKYTCRFAVPEYERSQVTAIWLLGTDFTVRRVKLNRHHSVNITNTYTPGNLSTLFKLGSTSKNVLSSVRWVRKWWMVTNHNDGLDFKGAHTIGRLCDTCSCNYVDRKDAVYRLKSYLTRCK